jgi:hypothetical protein
MMEPYFLPSPIRSLPWPRRMTPGLLKAAVRDGTWCSSSSTALYGPKGRESGTVDAQRYLTGLHGPHRQGSSEEGTDGTIVATPDVQRAGSRGRWRRTGSAEVIDPRLVPRLGPGEGLVED